jgi:hypothetical protein
MSLYIGSDNIFLVIDWSVIMALKVIQKEIHKNRKANI